MRRLGIIILSVVIGLTAFSQSPTKSISLRPAYPVAIGEKAVEGLAVASNGLYLHDTPSDSLPQYEIGHIYSQIVRYTEDGYGFYVKADSLHSHNVTFSYEVNNPPKGNFEFNNKTGRFKYYPAPDDYESFVVTFTATSGASTVTEDVEFNLKAQTNQENCAIQSNGTMPVAEDYTRIAECESFSDSLLNNTYRKVYSISISGKDVVFDNAVRNKVWGLSGRQDIRDLSIYAERLFIRSALFFPQTEVTIYTKEIIFEDNGNVVSSINTSPAPIDSITNEKGINAGNAGNISLYFKSFKGIPAKRLIANGGKGQCSNRNGLPGNGGNGGIVTSSLDISQYCDFARGSCGVKYGANYEEATSVGEVIGAGTMGQAGHFELSGNQFSYLHPYYLSPVLRHANDAFINNKPEAALQVCNEYQTLIKEYMTSAEWETCDTENEVMLQQDWTEINDMLLRLNQGLDYFGNPVGWVPLLSFEVMLNSYNTEIDRAIPTLYMYYWLSRVDQTLENKVKAKQFAATEAEQNIDNNLTIINQWIAEIPVLQDQADEIQSSIDILQNELNALEQQLLHKARKNVKKRNRIKKAIGVCRAVANCLPMLGPYGAAAGAAINGVLNSGVLNKFTDVDYSQTVKEIGNKAVSENFYKDLSKALKSAKDSIGSGGIKALGKTFDNLYKTAEPLITNITNVNNLLSHGSTPKSEVENELIRLKAQSPEYQRLEGEINTLNTAKAILGQRIKDLENDISTTLADVSENVIALDAFRREAFTGNSKRDLNAIQYLDKMQQRAKNRLLKYHYYLRKAYEYRLLKPYQGEFNLVSMYERFEALGMALGDVIDANAYSSLSAIFRDVVSGMAEEIIDEYSNNYPEQSAPITIVLSKEQLEAINTSDGITLNFHEMGVFAPDEENVRIVKLGVKHIESHLDGNVGYTGYMDLNMTHSGISQLRKDGQIYWFNHISKSTTSPHTWGIRYDAITHENTTIEPSAASASLLYSILNGNNIMLFSRPSAWGDINLTKKVHTSGGGDIVIDSLVLSLQYDFTRRPNKLRNIDITASDDLLPYIACSQADYNGRGDGNGNLYRSYVNSNQPVTFTASEKYENYYFVNWTDRAGRVVSEQKELTVNRMNDQFYTANYERRVPILSVPDTIMVSAGAGKRTVKVLNVGSGDLEMDWEVSDSLSTWVQVEGLAEGIDDGTFTLKYGKNTTGAQRIDILEIFAPETDEMVRTIYIVQGVPIRGDVNGDGIVNGADVTSLYSHLLTDTTVGGDPDVNEDGIVNGADVTALYTLLLQ